jgi:hypothetical protein
MTTPKVLFILKRREDYNVDKHSHLGLSTGLFNSANFMHQMLTDSGVQSKMVVVIDNNDIDREVTKFNPTHVIIEALWVVPTKFTVLSKLHPNVKWIIRLHSELPFLAGEGMALDWIGEYANFPNIIIAANAPRALEEVRFFLSLKMGWDEKETEGRVIYLPNYYPQDYKDKPYEVNNKKIVHISCFGAIRPLKNHVLQALAAVAFADSIDKQLHFHINSGRVEMKGGPVLNNLQGLFVHLHHSGHQLVNHEWTPREEFIQLCARMDIGMQVSISETFNIVGADLISQGVPLVGSNEIPWIDPIFSANAVETQEMYKALHLTHKHAQLNVHNNRKKLERYTNKTRNLWLSYFEK